jgi:cold shock protein
MQGTIKKLTDKHFGFIGREDGEKDLFFHANELDGIEYNDLQEGDNVTFETQDGPKGLSAVQVKKA